MAREVPHPHLYVEFYTEAQKDKRASQEQGRPIFRDVEMVHIRFIGDPTRDLRAPAHEKFIQAPRDRLYGGHDEDADGTRQQLSYAEYFHEHYDVFKQMNASSGVAGTPLAMLPFMTKRRLAELQARDVHTVEGLAGLADRLLKDCGPQTRDEREMAKAWLDKADQANAVAQVNAEKEALQAQLAAMQAQINAMARTPARAQAADSDPDSWEDDALRAFLDGKGHKVRANASRENLVTAVRAELAEAQEVVEA